MDQTLTRAAVLAAALACVGCGQTTPPFSHVVSNFPAGSVAVDDVVNHVKCDLAYAFDSRIAGPNADSTLVAQNQWLQNWTASVNLTLEVNEQGGITPAAVYTLPLRNAYNFGTGPSSSTGTAVSATQRNFTFGFGGTYTGQAVRTEILSFALSLKELKAWYYSPRARCDRKPEGLDLEGSIDLKSWVDEAFRPVDAFDLTSGNHVAPSAQAKAAAPTPSKSGGNAAAKEAEVQAVHTHLPTPPPTISIVNMQILGAACLAAAGADKANQAVCNADNSDRAKLFADCEKLAKGRPSAKSACATADNEFAKPNPNDDSTYYAATAVDAVNQAVNAAKQAADSNAQADSSAAQAMQSSNAADKAYREMNSKQVKSAVDGGFLDKVENSARAAKVASDNAATWDKAAADMSVCASNSAQMAKGSVNDADKAYAWGYYAVICAKLAGIVAKNAATDASAAASGASTAKTAPNPPIDSLSQSLEFVLTTGVTASPSWLLLYWKGPTPTGNLLNLQGIRTHTLDIALGPPGAAGAKTGQAQQNALQALQINRVTNAILNLQAAQ